MSHRSPITCHVLDSSIGKPAAGVEIHLQERIPGATDTDPDIFQQIARDETNSDGRCLALFDDPDNAGKTTLNVGVYKMVFKTKEYFETTGRKCFYPWVEITFEITDPNDHYHIPLLISPYSYTTYRGS